MDATPSPNPVELRCNTEEVTSPPNPSAPVGSGQLFRTLPRNPAAEVPSTPVFSASSPHHVAPRPELAANLRSTPVLNKANLVRCATPWSVDMDITPLPDLAPSASTSNETFQLVAEQPATLSHEVLMEIVRDAGSRHLFSWYLVKRTDIFSVPEKTNRNVYGGGKDRKPGLDTAKLNLVKHLTFRYIPVHPPGDPVKETEAWRTCVTAINKGLLRMKGQCTP